MTQQISKPLALFTVGLAARECFPLLSIDQDHRATILQQVKHRSLRHIPVTTMAITVTARLSNQSESANKPAVIGEEVRRCR